VVDRQAQSGQPAAVRVTGAIRDMIISGDLLPGQQIRQEQMATLLGVSRLPVREGLRQLMADGLVSHEHNVGFAVARLNRNDVNQLYRMRRLLESEVLGSLGEANGGLLDELTDLNKQIEAAALEMDLGRARMLNKEFHFAIFRLSPLTLVVAEIGRIWAWAMPYHSLSLHEPAGLTRITGEHRVMIEALREGRNERLTALMDQHRDGSEVQFSLMLGAGRPTHPA
jgi:DNA-binding GntR family transcriptional regulator